MKSPSDSLKLQSNCSVAQARIEELEKLKTPPPAFVKAEQKQPPEEQQTRKKRDAKYNRARPRSTPTQIVEHRLVNCPECQLRLGGISLARSREIIDVPPPPPVEVTEHRIYKGWCSGCQKWHEAPVDWHDQVVGQGRIGVRLASLIATLRTVMRLPIRQIQLYLLTLHGATISIGEIVELLHRVKAQMQPQLDALKTEIRASPAVQADETGWREDGSNGYIWSVSTLSIRYYEYHHSRAGEVVKHLIGEDYDGVLGSDFYAGYNIHEGLHQRCWVHYLRDAHELKEQYPHDEQLFSWAASVKAIYEAAVAWAEHGPDPHLSPRQQSMLAWHNSMPSSSNSGTCANPTWGPSRLNTPYVNAWNAFYPNSLSLSRCLVFQPTTIWRSAVCALSSLPARSVGEPAVRKAPRPVWDSPVSLAPGWHSTSILSTNAWLPSP